MTETLLPIVQKINGYLSDYILVVRCSSALVSWYSIKTRFVQVRCFERGYGTACSAASVPPRRKAGAAA